MQELSLHCLNFFVGWWDPGAWEFFSPQWYLFPWRCALELKSWPQGSQGKVSIKSNGDKALADETNT